MRSRSLWAWGAMAWAGWAAAVIAQDSRPAVDADKNATDNRRDGGELIDIDGLDIVVIDDVPQLEIFPIPAGTVFKRYEVGGDGSESVTAGSETLIYSNTRGLFTAPFPANSLVADDITTTAPNGCKLFRYEFPVTGKVNPAGIGGQYTVNFVLYSSCPQSVVSTDRPLLEIPGSRGTRSLPDEAPAMVSFEVPIISNPVPLPTNLWLAVSFNRGNCGVVLGAPADKGFSFDGWDFPGLACSSFLGGFPNQPHASFNAQIYGGDDCPPAYVAYRATRPAASGHNEGPGVTFVDDIQLVVNDCQMIAYEVAFREIGFYTLDLRRTCNGSVIAGTEKTYLLNPGSRPITQIARFDFNPPIPINVSDLFISYNVSSDVGGPILIAKQPEIGGSRDLYYVIDGTGQCVETDFELAAIHSTFSAVITCAGTLPLGACCDMFLPNANGDVVCRQLPEINCTFPPRGSTQEPAWEEGEACEPSPFFFPCGLACCCFPTDDRENMTQAQCNATPTPHLWERGQYCNVHGQRCPRTACLSRAGDCLSCPHPPGCENPDCCTDVCNVPDELFCCTTEWDCECVAIAQNIEGCAQIQVSNDECPPDPEHRLEGATLLTPGNPLDGDTMRGTEDPLLDPGFCCHTGGPGEAGFGSVWFKFVATQTSHSISTCLSNAPANDSLLQVFAVGDPTNEATQCNSLILIACNDDTVGCSDSETNSRVCLQNLVVGDIYYIMVAAKSVATRGLYKVFLSAGACSAPNPRPNDFCPNATPITDGVTPFDTAQASWDCPGEPCVPSMRDDLWYEYTATCDGLATIETCGEDADSSPDTDLVVYPDCTCPSLGAATLGCSDNVFGACGLGSRVIADVSLGNCYKIRLGDELGFPVSGNLSVRCAGNCPVGPVVFTSPPNGVVDARRPHAADDASQLLGINRIVVTAPEGAEPSCFTLCETAAAGSPNSIANVTEFFGSYTLNLARPITPGAVTTITYTAANNTRTTGVFTSHPANVNGDATASATTLETSDIIAHSNALLGLGALPWGTTFSGDIDLSTRFAPPDILEIEDLLTGSGVRDIWRDTPKPSAAGICPPP